MNPSELNIRQGLRAAFAAVCVLWGNGGFAQSPAAGEPATVLQRFIVTATPIPKRPWRYASFQGVEVLSRAADWKAEWWVEGLQRGFDLQSALLPKYLTEPFSTPRTLIIDDTAPAKVPVPTIGVPPTVGSTLIIHSELMPAVRPQETFSSSTYSHDADTVAGQNNLYEVGGGGDLLNCAWDLPFRITHYAPAPPYWLQVGLVGACGLMNPNIGGFIPRSQPEGGSGEGLPGLRGQPDYVAKAQFWLTDEATQKLQQASRERPPKVAFLPFEQLFSEALPKPDDAYLWACESALFIRWALISGYPASERSDPVRAAAFWRFVAGASRGPVTEEFFRNCFGFGYDRLKSELTSYLPVATRQQPAVPAFGEISSVSFRLATNDEVGRILGDWLRMKGESLRGADPSLAAIYFREAGKVLLRAYRGDLGMPTDSESDGERGVGAANRNGAAGAAVVMQPFVVSAAWIHDPALLAVYGLYESDVGDSAKAREFLEAAVKTGARRPAACLELARLRCLDALAHPRGADGKLSAAQTEFAFDPLLEAREMTPPNLAAYGLMIDIWLHSETKPTAADLGFLTEAIALYPRNAALARVAAATREKFGVAAPLGAR